MNSVKVKKSHLLDILKNNRHDHRNIFIDAQAKYKEAVIAELEKSLADARAGKQVDYILRLVQPEDHTRDYDRVIRMLELSIDEVIEMPERDFTQYVLDEWAWSHQWAASVSNYSKHPKLGNVE